MVLVVGARSCGHASSRTAGVEGDVRLPRERRIGDAGDRDRWYTEALELLQQRRELVGLAAFRDERSRRRTGRRARDRRARLGRMQEARGRAGGAKRRGDLPSDEPGLPDARSRSPGRRRRRASSTAFAKLSSRRAASAASASRSMRITVRPRSMSSAVFTAAPRASCRCARRDSRTTTRSHSPRALSSISANSRTAPWPPVRLSCTLHSAANLGHRIPDSDRKPDEAQHGMIRKIVADEGDVSSERDVVALEHALQRGELPRLRILPRSSTSSSAARSRTLSDTRPVMITTLIPDCAQKSMPRPSWMS